MSSDAVQQPEPKRIPKWIPIAAFVGTTVGLGVPLVFLARRRNASLQKALLESSAAPRRSGGTSSQLGRRVTAAPSEAAATSAKPSNAEHTSPGTGELLSAISKVDYSTAIFAGKAFGIATGIVTVSAVTLTLGVKTFMGVQDTQEFAQRMRLAVWRWLPGLTGRIHRPSELDEDGAPVVEPECDPDWNWEDAERRLQAAYASGGFPAWVQVAMKELEAELQVERARRRKELDEAERRAVS